MKLGPQRNGKRPAARRGRRPAKAKATAPAAKTPAATGTVSTAYGEEFVVDLERRREQLIARVAELQWDLGGLVYEMVVRNSVNVEVIVKRAVPLQDADAELAEVERILRMEESGTAGACGSCGAPHSSGATFCWQCGKPLLAQVSGEEILKG